MAKKSEQKVVVTTAHRGVFFGTLLERKDGEVSLADARVCVHWSAATRGFVGLAATGPLSGSRVSPACPKMTVTAVTCILECTPEAVKQWEEGKWS